MLERVQDEGHAVAGGDGDSVADDIEHLSQMQNYDGGFAFWDRGYPSEPYLTVYVTNALAHAKAKGFAVPRGDARSREAVPARTSSSTTPGTTREDVRWAISAYALYTRKQMGDLDIAKGQKLLRGGGGVDKLVDGDRRLAARPVRAATRPRADERKAIVRHALEHGQRDRGRRELHDRATATATTCCCRAIAASTA